LSLLQICTLDIEISPAANLVVCIFFCAISLFIALVVGLGLVDFRAKSEVLVLLVLLLGLLDLLHGVVLLVQAELHHLSCITHVNEWLLS